MNTNLLSEIERYKDICKKIITEQLTNDRNKFVNLINFISQQEEKINLNDININPPEYNNNILIYLGYDGFSDENGNNYPIEEVVNSLSTSELGEISYELTKHLTNIIKYTWQMNKLK